MRCWTQFAFARDVDGNSVDQKDPKAVVWDLEGAMRLWHGAMQWELQKRFQPYTKQHLCIYNDQMVKSNQEIIDLINKLLEEFDV
jgi:hypothetical protein